MLFIDQLAQMYPPPESVWVIGSRANGRATASSDTDLLILGSQPLMDMLRDQIRAPEKIDCLVVYDGNNYKDPWQDKSGSLEELEWCLISDTIARYVGTKWISDEELSQKFGADMGDIYRRVENGIRIWPPS